MTDRPGAQDILDNVADAVVVVDRSGTIVYVNVAAADLFGYVASDLVGSAVEVLVPDVARNTHARMRSSYARRPVARTMGTGLPLEAQRRDGAVIEVDIMLQPLDPWVVASIRPVGWRSAEERQLIETLETIDQHVFAVGMSLAGLRNVVPESSAARLDDAIALVERTLDLARERTAKSVGG